MLSFQDEDLTNAQTLEKIKSSHDVLSDERLSNQVSLDTSVSVEKKDSNLSSKKKRHENDSDEEYQYDKRMHDKIIKNRALHIPNDSGSNLYFFCLL